LNEFFQIEGDNFIKVEIFENEYRGNKFLYFEGLDTWILFDLIADIIENKVLADNIDKIDGDWFRKRKYKKNDLEFELHYNDDVGTYLCLSKASKYRDKEKNTKKLKDLAEKILIYINS